MVISTLFVIISYLIVFLVGRIYGQFESAVVFSQRINSLIDALKKAEKTAHSYAQQLVKKYAKNRSLSKELLEERSKELIERARKQMELKQDD